MVRILTIVEVKGKMCFPSALANVASLQRIQVMIVGISVFPRDGHVRWWRCLALGRVVQVCVQTVLSLYCQHCNAQLNQSYCSLRYTALLTEINSIKEILSASYRPICGRSMAHDTELAEGKCENPLILC